MRYFLLIFFIALSCSAKASKKSKLDLKPTTVKELTQVFNQVDRLRQFMFEANDRLVGSQIEFLKVSIQKAISATKKESIKGQHISRLLMSAQDSLVSAQNTSGKQKIKFIQDAFKQLVTLYQSTKLELKYSVYWCKIDRAVWIQKAGKIQNPFEPRSNCGRVIN